MNNTEILIIEDSELERKLLEKSLGESYQIDTAESAEMALSRIESKDYDIVLLDVQLPGMDGYRFCAQLKGRTRSKDTAVIFITGKQFKVEDKLMGFSLGAVDYLIKPVDIRELKARIEVHLQKSQPRTEENRYYRVGPFEIDTQRQAICYDNKEEKVDIPMSTLEYRLLQFFLRHKDHVVTRDQLLDSVWGNSRAVTDRSVDVLISKIRAKLGPFSNSIKAVRGCGYRFSVDGLDSNREDSTKVS